MRTPQAQSSSPTRAVIAFAVVAALGGFLFGFDTTVINGAVDAVEGQYDLSSFVTGSVVAVALLGSAVGAWYAGPSAATSPTRRTARPPGAAGSAPADR